VAEIFNAAGFSYLNVTSMLPLCYLFRQHLTSVKPSPEGHSSGVTLGVRCFSIVLLHLCKASHKLFYDKYIVMQSRHTHADGKLLIA